MRCPALQGEEKLSQSEGEGDSSSINIVCGSVKGNESPVWRLVCNDCVKRHAHGNYSQCTATSRGGGGVYRVRIGGKSPLVLNYV